MCYSTVHIRTDEGPIHVNCGQCAECLAQRRAQWTFRLQQEAKQSRYPIFLTLTYEEEKLPLGNNIIKKDVQDFMKRLRKNNPNRKLRYYAIGEYGGKFDRPHYHLILWGVPPKAQERISKVWKNGIVKIGTVTQASIHYVTGYIMEKLDKTKGREPPFALMSRNPPLGENYLFNYEGEKKN